MASDYRFDIFTFFKDYKIGICCFLTEHVSLKSKSKDWLTQGEDNVFEWRETCLHVDQQ